MQLSKTTLVGGKRRRRWQKHRRRKCLWKGCIMKKLHLVNSIIEEENVCEKDV